MLNFYPELMKKINNSTVKNEAYWSERRKELLEILQNELFGHSPDAPKCVNAKIEDFDKTICTGYAKQQKITLSFETEKGEFSFDFDLILPKTEKKVPVFVNIRFIKEFYSHRTPPIEEIVDNGFALASVCYKNITSDDENMQDGLAKMFTSDWGKIGMWAWATSRIIDYLQTRDEIDSKNIAVIGHSRLGKTALWCSAQDSRVRLVCANDSGCAGAAYERVKHGNAETTKAIVEKFPYWFCKNYKKYADNADKMPFDQHFLIALCAPRNVCIGSADEDFWADPYSEQLSCIAASPAWEIFGKQGFVGQTSPAKSGDNFDKGCIGYHLRKGVHFLSRTDWCVYIDYFKKLL